jgi:DNA methyltransferase 1-associated protein 1
LTGLFDRTPEQIAEEEQLYVEIKRLELNEKRYAKERDDLLRTFAGVESGLPGLQANWDISTGVPIDKKRKKRVEGDMTLDSPIGGPSSSMLPPKRRDIGKQSASGMSCLIPFLLRILNTSGIDSYRCTALHCPIRTTAHFSFLEV